MPAAGSPESSQSRSSRSILRQFDVPIFVPRHHSSTVLFILFGSSFGRKQKDFLPHRLTLVAVIHLSIHTSQILLYQSPSALDSSSTYLHDLLEFPLTGDPARRSFRPSLSLPTPNSQFSTPARTTTSRDRALALSIGPPRKEGRNRGVKSKAAADAAHWSHDSGAAWDRA